jgi:acyl carrier protein
MNARIRALLAACGGLSADAASISNDSDLYSAGLKSHACVELMLALEEAFDVEFSDEMLTRATFRSVASIEKTVSALRQKALAA